MPMAMVEKVLPLLKDAKYIWLSGFGEPLMHEDLVQSSERSERQQNHRDRIYHKFCSNDWQETH